MSLEERILNRIKNENLKIVPAYFFTLKTVIFTIGALILCMLGSLSSGLFFETTMRQGKIAYFLIALFGIFLFAGYWLLKKIDFVCRMRFITVASLLFCMSLSLGFMAFASGEAEEIERRLERVPAYAMVVPENKDIASFEEKRQYKYYHEDKYTEKVKENLNIEKQETPRLVHNHHSRWHDEKSNNRKDERYKFEKDDDIVEPKNKEKARNEGWHEKDGVKNVIDELKKKDEPSNKEIDKVNEIENEDPKSVENGSDDEKIEIGE